MFRRVRASVGILFFLGVGCSAQDGSSIEVAQGMCIIRFMPCYETSDMFLMNDVGARTHPATGIDRTPPTKLRELRGGRCVFGSLPFFLLLHPLLLFDHHLKHLSLQPQGTCTSFFKRPRARFTSQSRAAKRLSSLISHNGE